MFLKNYATALVKEQWGMNLSKFEGVQLPGGVTLNGRAILEDARAEIALRRTESLTWRESRNLTQNYEGSTKMLRRLVCKKAAN